MHYYSHNVGDYRRDTSHLSMLEHGAYRQLMDTYYLTEKPLSLSHADLMRTHSARSADEVQAIENVLKDFFIRTDEGYIHKRCDVEIEAFHAKSSSASESAKARWARVRAEKEADAMRTHSEGNANHKPITNNQEPSKSSCPQQADDGHRFRFAEIQEAYNRICSPTLPACRAANESRRRQVKLMVDLEFNGKRPFREHGLKMWESYFADCLTNKHWIGENDRNWRADFDFVTLPKNAIKLLERVCG